jgi:prophage regulatory protein
MNTPTPSKLLRLPVVLERSGLSKPSIYRLMKLGQFPLCRKISIRAVAWSESELSSWIESR